MGRVDAAARVRELGAELRKQREAAGVTGKELANRVGWSQTKISRIEHGTRLVDPIELVEYLGYCGIFRPTSLELLELRREAEFKLGYWLSPYGDWLQDSLASLIYHEAAADRSTVYQPQLVHGLLQTADYARARVGAERWRSLEDVEQFVRIRMQRQRILRADNPASFRFYLHEQALRLEVGSAAIMHEQLLKIVFLAALDHIGVRVVRTSAADGLAFGGPFHLLEYQGYPSLIYLDNHATGLFLEDREYVEPYRDLVPAIADVALDAGQSREFIAALADEFDRGSTRDVGDRVEEEQL